MKIEKCKRNNTIDIEAEREMFIESLKNHLSEYRHDFFNLLQVLYGYTQLNKPDKVLQLITEYCRQMENIGILYNCKCIKLADLLYNKVKEAESVDLKLEVSIKVSFDSNIRILDEVPVIYIVDHVILGFLYMLDERGMKDYHVVYNLKENSESYQMEIYCREIREGQGAGITLTFPEQAIYWKKAARDVLGFDTVKKYCSDIGFDGRMLKDELTFILNISKVKKGE
jgi:sensor histidine kinase regulating citrate/malate metabolism